MWDDCPRARSGFKQLVRLDAKGKRELLDVVDRDVPDLALNVSHEGPVQAGLEGQRLLGKLLGPTERHEVGSQHGPGTDPPS